MSASSPPAWQKPAFLLALTLLSLLVFLFVTYSVLAGGYLHSFDQRLLTLFDSLRQQAPAWFLTVSTWFQNASSVGVTIVTVLLLGIWLFARQYRWFSLLLAAVGGAELLWLGLVFGIGRERPRTVTIWGGITLPSYPSGHAMVNVAFFGVLIYIFYYRLKNKNWNLFLVGIALLLLLLVGLNRLLFSVHYITDLVAGYAVGVAWTAFAIWLVEWVILKGWLESKPEVLETGN